LKPDIDNGGEECIDCENVSQFGKEPMIREHSIGNNTFYNG
jgi:hypothetical protein